MTTSKLSTYSTTAASNNSAAPNGWPEGMLPSDVNNCAREGMARVREWYEDAQWINFGHTIVSSTGTTIVVSGDQTAIYSTYRAIRVNQSASQDGWVTSSTYSAPNTTITVNGFTVSSPTLVEVGAITSATSLPINMEMVIYSASFNGTITAGIINAQTITTATLNATTLGTITTATIDTLNVGTLNATSVATMGCATQAQMEAEAASLPVSPDRVKYSPAACKAWCYVSTSGASITIGASYNVASVTRSTADRFRFTWTTPFSSANYATPATIECVGGAIVGYAKTSTYVEFTTSGSVPEIYNINVAAFGDFA